MYCFLQISLNYEHFLLFAFGYLQSGKGNYVTKYIQSIGLYTTCGWYWATIRGITVLLYNQDNFKP